MPILVQSKLTPPTSLREKVSRLIVAFASPFERSPKADCLTHTVPKIKTQADLKSYLEKAIIGPEGLPLFSNGERKSLIDLADTPESTNFIGKLLHSKHFSTEEIQTITATAKTFEGDSQAKTLDTVYGIAKSLFKKLGKGSHHQVTGIISSAETLKQLETKNGLTHELAGYVIHRYSQHEIANIVKITKTSEEALDVVLDEAEKGNTAKGILEELEKFRKNPTAEGKRRRIEREERLAAYEQAKQLFNHPLPY